MKNINQEILEHLLTIPKGKVTTYKNIAVKFGVHPRKVAAVMKYNKYPEIYPCYKVVAHNCKVSGYNTKGGINEKIKKLEADGVVIEKGVIKKEHII